MRGKVLLIEDDRDTQVIVSSYLQREYDVRCAADAKSGLEMANEDVPDLILLDMALPRHLDGLEVARRLCSSEKFRDTKVVAFTIHDELRDEIMSAGCHGLIPKPVDPHDLVETVHGLLPPDAK
jgi:DNA-binding response OmpR family regulator